MADNTHPRQNILSIIEQRQSLDDRFEDLRRIAADGGNGVFSVLVSAYDRKTRTRVALKFFDPLHRLASDNYRWNSFQREANILTRFIGQPDILQSMSGLREFNQMTYTSGGLPFPVPFAYYATELASKDAAQALANREWTPAERLRQFRVMCRAVQRIHSLGTMHRDLKPSNYLIMPNDSLKLSDFGTDASPMEVLRWNKYTPSPLAISVTQLLN